MPVYKLVRRNRGPQLGHNDCLSDKYFFAQQSDLHTKPNCFEFFSPYIRHVTFWVYPAHEVLHLTKLKADSHEALVELLPVRSVVELQRVRE